MGWNSWDCYGTTVTEQEVKANADYMTAHLRTFGWEYMSSISAGMSKMTRLMDTMKKIRSSPFDGYGRLIPAVHRFPSSSDGRGFKPLADYIHSKDLKFGIHIMRASGREPLKGTLQFREIPQSCKRNLQHDRICAWLDDM